MTRTIDDTHDPALRSWVASANGGDTDFPIQNLPFGIFRSRGSRESGRIGVAIGDAIVCMRQAGELGVLDALPAPVRGALGQPQLNAFMALGTDAWAATRRLLSRVLRITARPEPGVLVAIADAEMLMPALVGNYTDFYASVHHATNVGRLFRPDSPLLPNYRHLPIAYHARASSVVVTGTPVRRPSGQSRPPGAQAPSFEPTKSFDFELEVGVFVGPGNQLGHPVPIDRAEDHLFGVCLLNDWSARDIQSWEYQPLGPFLAKSFATTISPWVVTLDALAPFRVAGPERSADDPESLSYLRPARADGGLDVRVEAAIATAAMREARMAPATLARSSTRHLYWTVSQMVAHHTSNGCNLEPGDLLGTGTLSGPDEGSRACLLEITAQGKQPIALPTGERRSFLEDGDEIVLRGHCERDGYQRIGLGECRGLVTSARP
jgi:fumarylacetoacetase